MATWSLAGGDVELSPFGELSDADAAALAADAGDVRRFLGLAAPAQAAGRRRGGQGLAAAQASRARVQEVR